MCRQWCIQTVNQRVHTSIHTHCKPASHNVQAGNLWSQPIRSHVSVRPTHSSAPCQVKPNQADARRSRHGPRGSTYMKNTHGWTQRAEKWMCYLHQELIVTHSHKRSRPAPSHTKRAHRTIIHHHSLESWVLSWPFDCFIIWISHCSF